MPMPLDLTRSDSLSARWILCRDRITAARDCSTHSLHRPHTPCTCRAVATAAAGALNEDPNAEPMFNDAPATLGDDDETF
jgi:hypothetical protein